MVAGGDDRLSAVITRIDGCPAGISRRCSAPQSEIAARCLGIAVGRSRPGAVRSPVVRAHHWSQCVRWRWPTSHHGQAHRRQSCPLGACVANHQRPRLWHPAGGCRGRRTVQPRSSRRPVARARDCSAATAVSRPCCPPPRLALPLLMGGPWRVAERRPPRRDNAAQAACGGTSHHRGHRGRAHRPPRPPRQAPTVDHSMISSGLDLPGCFRSRVRSLCHRHTCPSVPQTSNIPSCQVPGAAVS